MKNPFSRFFRRSGPPTDAHLSPVHLKPLEAITHEMVPEILRVKASIVKTGKWVYHLGEAQVGILTNVNDYPVVKVMLVNQAGENFREVSCTLGDIRPAKRMEIPAQRRPSEQQGAILGYF